LSSLDFNFILWYNIGRGDDMATVVITINGNICKTDPGTVGFSINGLSACIRDFGFKEDQENGENECTNFYFIGNNDKKAEAMRKYDITETEFNEIVAELTTAFNVGQCNVCYV
jgi:hypothetical protein